MGIIPIIVDIPAIKVIKRGINIFILNNIYIFDIYDTIENKYIPHYVYEAWFNLIYKNLKYIPLMESLENPTEDDIKLRLGKTGDFLCTAGLGEGIVIKNYDFNGYRCVLFARSAQDASNIKRELLDYDIDYQIFFDVKPDPTLSTVEQALTMVRPYQPDLIIALGGGSPMDVAKIIWLMYEHPETNFEDISMRFLDIRKRICGIPDLGEKLKLVCIQKMVRFMQKL